MSQWANEVRKLFRESSAVFGVAFIVNGNSYTGVMRSTDQMANLMTGGFLEDFAGSLEYDDTDVTLAAGMTLTIGSKAYRVERVGGSDEDPIKQAFLIGRQR